MSFILKDWYGNEKEFDHDKIFFRDKNGGLVQFTQGATNSKEINQALDLISGEVIGEEQFNVTFKNGAEVITIVPTYEGYDCIDPVNSGLIDVPTKESTKYIKYTFIGWSLTDGGVVDKSALLSIDGDRTVYATYREDYIYIAKGSWVYEDPSLYLNWNINPDYVLTISGNVESYDTPDYTPYLSGEGYLAPPWWNHKDDIRSVVVNCKDIGTGWFYSCSKLSEAFLSNSLLNISIRAFSECSSLKSIELPSSLRIIAHNAFDTSALESITIPTTVKHIFKGAFCHTPLTNAVFEKTDSWYYSVSQSNVTTQGTPLEESQVEDASFMASLLTDTKNYTFENADAK